MKRAVVFCPGRGSYTAAQLGSLAGVDGCPELADAVDRVDAARTAAGDLGIRAMDAADGFRARFLLGHNAAPLIFTATALDALRIDRERIDVVAIGGNSMGWYSALWAAGALDLPSTFRLVETMAGMTREGSVGGQILYPAVDEEWRHDAALDRLIDAAVTAARDAGAEAGDSIRFGGTRVLWGDEAALDVLSATLPSRSAGRNEYPLRLLGNSAFHSPLMAPFAARAEVDLADLPIVRPRISLLDGRGKQWSPLSASTDAIAAYTLGQQVVATYDFAASVRVALREYAPDYLVALGPGDSMGAAIAQVLIAEGWDGIENRDDFLRRQEKDPLVISMARTEQAERVVR